MRPTDGSGAVPAGAPRRSKNSHIFLAMNRFTNCPTTSSAMERSFMPEPGSCAGVRASL